MLAQKLSLDNLPRPPPPFLSSRIAPLQYSSIEELVAKAEAIKEPNPAEFAKCAFRKMTSTFFCRAPSSNWSVTEKSSVLPFGRSRWCSAVVGMKEAGQKRLKEGKAEDAYVFLFRVPLYYSKVRLDLTTATHRPRCPPHPAPPRAASAPTNGQPKMTPYHLPIDRHTEAPCSTISPLLQAWVSVETWDKAG